MFVALDETRWTIEGHLDTIKTLEGASIVEAMRARWKTFIVSKTVAANEFVQYYCSAGNPDLHSRLEGVSTNKNNIG